jgi:hypothetical protein
MSDATSIALRRIDAKLHDIEQLISLYAAVIDTPKVVARLRQGISPAKPLACTVSAPPLQLRLQWSPGYPDVGALEVTCLQPEPDSAAGATLSRQVEAFAAACAGSGTAYAVDIVRYAVELMESLVPAAADIDTSTGLAETRVFILQFNHLLKGPEHKKEKDMVSAGKSCGLVGGVVYGTPGYVALTGGAESSVDVADYLRDCRSIGKRGEIIHEGKYYYGASEEAKLKKGFTEFLIADLEIAVGGPDAFRSIRVIS